MANMTAQQRIDCANEMAREISDGRESMSLSRADFRAAVDAADAWANSNAASFNTALPVAARNNLTSAQKARLLAFVVRYRWSNGA